MNDFITTLKSYEFYKKLEKLPFVEQIVLFGSRARGDAQERSDIDLAILSPDASWNEWLTVLEIVEEADTLLKIDCLRFDTLEQSSPIRHNIENEGIIIYVKN